jgi:type II secretory pathway pseudopilin PulG
MIMEGKKGRSALTQSKAYVYGKSWKVFGRMFLLYLIYLVPYIILEAVSLTNKGGVAGIVATILLIILQIVFSVYLISFMFTLYKQLKNSAGTVNGEQYRGAVTGWAIWGGVSFVLFFVIGLGSSVVLLALNSARAKARDAKRVADVRQIAAGEELYYNDNNSYPSTLQNLETNYLGQVPTPPQPADGFCTIGENQYSYKLLDSGHYELTFCLGEVTNGYPAGKNTLTEKGIDVGHVSDTPDMQAPLNIPAQ